MQTNNITFVKCNLINREHFATCDAHIVWQKLYERAKNNQLDFPVV